MSHETDNISAGTEGITLAAGRGANNSLARITSEEAKQHFEQIRQGTLREDSRSLRAALKLLAEELNTKESHFILELLQNAEDNEYAGKNPELSLCIETNDPTGTPSADGCLVVLNNEVGFQVENARSLSSVGQSTKKNRNQGYIGEKGIGFKSVFRVTDSPYIFSNGFQFRFQIPTESEGFGYILPHWVETVPPVVKEGYTGILLPLQPGKRELITHQLSKIAPETILFLKKLKRLHLGEGRSISSNGEAPLVRLRSNDEESLYFVYNAPFDKPDGITEEKRTGISRRDVTVAFPLKTSTTCKGRIFAFLPTEFDSGLPFLVNGDFILNSNRERVLEDRRWNQWLRDGIAPTFVKAFLAVLNEVEWRTGAWRFVPIASDLNHESEFFAPIVESVQRQLQGEECILTEDGSCKLPSKVFCPGPLTRRVLSDVPRNRFKFALLDSRWEPQWKTRLEPLGVQSLTFSQVFDACNEPAWLESQEAEWWEILFELCAKCDVSAETIGSFPILPCQDGSCRPISSGIFFQAENQTALTGISTGWPVAHFIDTKLQTRLQLKPAIWTWLTGVARLSPFSVQSYIIGSLLDWMRQQTDIRLIEPTRFVGANLKHLDQQARKTIRERMPWLLADGSVFLPQAGKELVTPECLEGNAGWNLLFCALDRHFFVIHDDYCAALSGDSMTDLREIFKTCGATAFPDPRLRELSPGDTHYSEALARCAHAVHGTPSLRDWAAPGWLLGLESVEQTSNGPSKIKALERWLTGLGPDYITKLLLCGRPDYQGDWQQISAWSEFGRALHNKPWLRTSKGYMAPPAAFLDTPEFREFFGDSAAYVATDIATQLLEKLGVHVHLTSEVLIAHLREISGRENSDVALLGKIYRRLQDISFDANLFRSERLIFLAQPKPRWFSSQNLVWNDAGELFDDHFGYVSLTYGSDLHRFFTEKLKIPAQPELKQYAIAWRNLCSTTTPDRPTLERKLRSIFSRLAERQTEFSESDWWCELKPQLRFWTDRGEFQPPDCVYVPDHSTAAELFTGLIHLAFPLKPNRTVLDFLRSIPCRSLAAAVQMKLVAAGETARPTPVFLTPAARELCVLLVCSHQGWEGRRSLLQALLNTTEASVNEITVEYSLNDNRDAGARPIIPDGHWDVASRRLLVRNGVDEESLRDATAKSIATGFFGEAASVEMQAEFFRVLTVGLERARKLMRERSNWRLTLQQQAWLREQDWGILITELDEVEQLPAPRQTQEPPNTTAPAPVLPKSLPSSTKDNLAPAQSQGSAASQTTTTARTQQRQETPRSETPPATEQQKAEKEPSGGAPDELHDADTTTADFVEVRAHTRSRPQRQSREQSRSSERAATSGLTTATQESKAALEQCGRNFATQKLQGMGYTVTPMGQRSPGYDMLALKPGDTLKVEVKAHAGEASSVFITQREWEEHLKTCSARGEAWELWNVENLAKSSGKNPTIQRVRQIPKSAMKESGYWIDLSQCPQEPSR